MRLWIMPSQLGSAKHFKFLGTLELASCVQQACMLKWVFFPPKYITALVLESAVSCQSQILLLNAEGVTSLPQELQFVIWIWTPWAQAGCAEWARLYPWRKNLQPQHQGMSLAFDTEKALKGWGRACGQSPLQGISSSSSLPLNDAKWVTGCQHFSQMFYGSKGLWISELFFMSPWNHLCT